MNRFIKIFIELIPNKQSRNDLRSYYKFRNFKNETFIYRGKELRLFQHEHNCGFANRRMTERCLELALVFSWLEKTKGEIFEIGAVTPYYFPRAVTYICDPYDPSPAVTHKCSLFNLDLTDKNVLCVSTIEHVGTGECGLKPVEGETAVKSFEKIVTEAKKCLITFPVGYNKALDEYFISGEYKQFLFNTTVSLYGRNERDNIWKEEKDLAEIKNYKYGPNTANAVVIIEK